MAAKQPVWGIDVGQCSLKAIKLQAIGPEEFELQGFDLVEHPDILSQTDEDPTDMVADAIRIFAERNDLTGCRLAVAVPGEQTLTKFTKMPPVEKKKIPDMVQYEASQQIPFDMDEVVWDYQVFGDTEGAEIEVGIFAIRKELIRNYLMLYTEVGLEPELVQTSPIGSYNTARFEMPMPEGEAAVLLDMGAVATDLIIIDGERIWSRPVPIGGNKFTESLVSAFKINFKKAEKLKRNAGSSKYKRQIFQAMRPVFGDLVSEIQRSIGFYTAAHRDSNVTKVIGMGNAFKLPGLQKFLTQNLHMGVEELKQYKHLRLTDIEKKEAFDENIMSTSVAYGVALQGLELAVVDSTLLPVEFKRQILWKKKKPWFTGAAAMLAVAGGALMASNSMARGTISNAGDLTTNPMFPTAEAAESAVSSASTIQQPITRAKTVAAAADKLKQLQSQADQQPEGVNEVTSLAKYPGENVYVPAIVSIVTQAFDAAHDDKAKSFASAAEYLEYAENMPRRNREEAWIDSCQVIYDPAPEKMGRHSKFSAGRRSRAGWYVRIVGITPLNSPANWLEENIVKNIELYGRRPNMGIYIDEDSVALGDIVERNDENRLGNVVTTGSTSVDRDPSAGRGRGRAGGGRPGGRRPGRGRPGGGRQAPGGRDAPGRGGLPGRGGDGRGDSPAEDPGKKLEEELKPYREGDKDYLTGEPIEGDKNFVIEFIVTKGNVPGNLIPEKFKGEATGNEPTSASGDIPPEGLPPSGGRPNRSGN